MENNVKREEEASAENNGRHPITPTVVEVSAKTVEEAIATGLAQLGVPREKATIEIIREGSRGVLGLGAAEAQVRLALITPPERPGVMPDTQEVTPPPTSTSTVTGTSTLTGTSVTPDRQDAIPIAAVEESPDEEQIAREVLSDMLRYMGITATVQKQIALPQSLAEQGDSAPLVLDILGADLGVLLGRHGETLNALQYIMRLIVSHRLKRRANLIVDVESYRVRREKSLRQLAQRMAERACRERRTIRLEAMSAYDRRIVHLALHDDQRVTTQSEGEGHNRRVTIIPV